MPKNSKIKHRTPWRERPQTVDHRPPQNRGLNQWTQNQTNQRVAKRYAPYICIENIKNRTLPPPEPHWPPPESQIYADSYQTNSRWPSPVSQYQPPPAEQYLPPPPQYQPGPSNHEPVNHGWNNENWNDDFYDQNHYRPQYHHFSQFPRQPLYPQPYFPYPQMPPVHNCPPRPTPSKPIGPICSEINEQLQKQAKRDQNSTNEVAKKLNISLDTLGFEEAKKIKLFKSGQVASFNDNDDVDNEIDDF